MDAMAFAADAGHGGQNARTLKESGQLMPVVSPSTLSVWLLQTYRNTKAKRLTP
jgi:hypothetical protein